MNKKLLCVPIPAAFKLTNVQSVQSAAANAVKK